MMPGAPPDDARDERRERDGVTELTAPLGLEHRTRDAPGARLLAVFAQHAFQLGFVDAMEPLRDARAAAAIHAHVERARAREAEATIRLVELERRDAEIEEDTVDRVPADGLENFADVRVRAGADRRARAEARETTRGALARGLVPVDTEELAVRRGRVEDRFRVSRAAERAVDVAAAGARREPLDRLAKENGMVNARRLGRHVPKDQRFSLLKSSPDWIFSAATCCSCSHASAIPDAEAVARAAEDDFLLEPRPFAERGRDQDSSLRIDLAGLRVADEKIFEAHHVRIEAPRAVLQLLVELFPDADRIRFEPRWGAVRAARDHELRAAGRDHHLAIASWDADAPLGVDEMDETAAKHPTTPL